MGWQRLTTAFAVFLVLAGCEMGHVVWVVGDSTSAQLGEELQAQANLKSVVDGEPGDLYIPIATQGLAALGRDLSAFALRLESASARGVISDAVVVLLGTNDMANDFVYEGTLFHAWSIMDTPEERAAAIDGLMGKLPDGVPVLWIVPDPPTYPLERRAAIAASLTDAQARWPRLYLMSPEPSWFEGTNADGIHFTPETESTVAAAIAARVRLLTRSDQ